MNEEQAYAAIDALQAEIKEKKAAIAAILDELNMEFVIQCEWTEDYTPHCTSPVMAGTTTYFSPRHDYPGMTRAMSRKLPAAKKFKSRRDAQWVLDECLMHEESDKRRAQRLKQIWSIVSIPHNQGVVK